MNAPRTSRVLRRTLPLSFALATAALVFLLWLFISESSLTDPYYWHTWASRGGYARLAGGDDWRVGWGRTWWVTRLRWQDAATKQDFPQSPNADGSWPEFDPPAWSEMVGAPHDGPARGMYLVEWGYGWPATAFVGRARGQWPRMTADAGWMQHPGRGGAPDSALKVGVTAVWWPGLVLDLALYWAALFVLIAAVPLIPAVRHDYRLARKRCVRCAYPLTELPPGSPCPECGRSAANTT